MCMRSKELKNYNLPSNRMFNEVLEAKPKVLLSILIVIGVVLLFVQYYIYGVVLLILGFSSFLFLPNRRLIEFYDDYMIIYNKARKDECNIIYYEDVKSWEYIVKVSYDTLILYMEDGSIQKCDGYSKASFENCLNKYLRDKKIVTKAKKSSK